ncbi:MAG: hypothetical protein MK137_01930 [Rickettsiales bacterium]|nr:hypothetical protein [Rickettsiales bacterium]
MTSLGLSIHSNRLGGGYFDISRPSVISSSQSFSQNRTTQTDSDSAPDTKRLQVQSLLSEQMTKTLQKDVQNVSERVTNKTTFSVDYSRTTLIGQSSNQQALLEQYQSLGASATPSIILDVIHNDKKSTITIGADFVTLPDGQWFSLRGTSLTDALKANKIQIDGDLSVNVSTVKSFNYVDESGIEQTQNGFTIVQYSFTDEKGNTQSGAFAIDNSSSDQNPTSSEEASSVVVEEEYNATNTIEEEIGTEHFYQIFVTPYDGPTPLEVQQKYFEQQRYLNMIQNVTSENSLLA